jgi:hypothetical protein
MASFLFDAYAEAMAGTGTKIDFDADTIKVRAISDNVIVPARTLTVMSTITKYVGSTDPTLSNKTIGTIAARTMDNTATVSLGSFAQDGANDIDALVIYKFVTNDADSIPMIYIDLSAAATPNGNEVTIDWNALGICLIDA